MKKVEQGVPLPPITYRGGRAPRYPFETILPGESFFCETIPATSHWRRRTGKVFVRRSAVDEQGKKGWRIFCVGEDAHV